jgi:hypothetical protein
MTASLRWRTGVTGEVAGPAVNFTYRITLFAGRKSTKIRFAGRDEALRADDRAVEFLARHVGARLTAEFLARLAAGDRVAADPRKGEVTLRRIGVGCSQCRVAAGAAALVLPAIFVMGDPGDFNGTIGCTRDGRMGAPTMEPLTPCMPCHPRQFTRPSAAFFDTASVLLREAEG